MLCSQLLEKIIQDFIVQYPDYEILNKERLNITELRGGISAVFGDVRNRKLKGRVFENFIIGVLYQQVREDRNDNII